MFKLISELVTDPAFPHSAVGEPVNINGHTGVIVEVVKNSIKVRSAEGNTVSYNFHTLRRLHSPRPAPEAALPHPEAAGSTATTPPPTRRVILEPDFDSPLVPIESLVHAAGFPECAFGAFVDFHGFAGVIVELVGSSVRVRSREGSTRSYNADGLRKIYGKLPSPGSAPSP